MPQQVGVILSGATTQKAVCQLLEESERRIREGMFLVTITNTGDSEIQILSRVSNLATYNEFYEVGDIWSEARRKGHKIPVSVARKYVVCELELIGILPNLKEVTIPPAPGDGVFLLDKPHELFLSVKKAGVYMDFGTIYGYENAPIPLSVEALPMHIAILGVTGSGKSYTVGYLLEKLSSIKIGDRLVGIPGIIIDANGDYLDYYESFHNGEFECGYSKIYRFVFSNSSAAKEDFNATRIKIDLNLFEPRELAELIMDYYKTSSGSELAISLLEDVFSTLRSTGYGNLNYLFAEKDMFEREILAGIDKMKTEQRYHHQTVGAAKRAVSTFRTDLEKFGLLVVNPDEATVNEKLIDSLTENHELAIFDFSVEGATGISVKMKQLVVAYLTILLYKRFVDYKMGRVPTKMGYRGARYAIFIIEEAQYYCPNLATYPVGSSVAREYLSLIATQGRKFGLGLILVTQRPAFVDPIVMSMINTYFIHRISPDDLTYVKRATGGLPESLARRLTSLETGTLIVSGQMVPVPFPLLIRIPKRKITPTVGATFVSEYLRREVHVTVR